MTEIGECQEDFANEMKALAPAGDFKIAPAHGIAAIALNMAVKYHDMQMIPDGLTYQQYKMEGRNIKSIGLDDVFETAMKMEIFLLGASDRFAKIIMDAVQIVVDEDEAKAEQAAETGADPAP